MKKDEGLSHSSSTTQWDLLRGPVSPESKERKVHDSHKIGEAMLDANDMAAGASYDMSERKHFTREEIRHYRDDAYRHNIDYMERAGVDESLKQSYKDMMREYPFLKNVVLGQIHEPGMRDEDVQNARSCYATMTGEGVRQMVVFNFENPDIYLPEQMNGSGDMTGFYSAIVEIALRVGAKPAKIAKNRALVSTFVMAHEFGHAMDFQQNFLAPAVADAKRRGAKSELDVIALPEALAKQRDSRSADMAGMLSGKISTDGNTRLRDIIRSRFIDLDLRSHEERAIYEQKSYRTCRSENFADSFAMNFVMRHYDRFFYDPRKGEAANGRVATNLYGETKNVGEQLLPFLDFHAGKHVDMKILGDNNSVRSLNGYLAQNLRPNGEMSLNLSGDPANNRSNNIQKLGKIRDVRLKQERGPHGAINTFYLMMDNFTTIEMSVSGNGEAPSIDVMPEDFLNRYHISEGSQLSLLKRKVKNGEVSEVSTGGLLFGKLKKNQKGSLIEKNLPIYLDADQASGATGGNTSNIKRFYRKWKRYYVETNTSTYELLPYSPKQSQH